MDLLVISGLSGAGKSTALGALEDLGTYCVDNLPVPLLPELVALLRRSDEARPIAVGIDAREAEYLERFGEVHAELVGRGLKVAIVFLEANRDALVRRYSETRRMHPMGDLPEAIDRERELMAPIRRLAERPVDTSSLTGRQLRQRMRDHYHHGATLRLVLTSFAFRRGVPSEADLVFDARFLANPNELTALRPLSGLHEPVAQYVLQQPDAIGLLDRIDSVVRFTAPRSAQEGRSHLTVAIGCTGGQHRSVALIEELNNRLSHGDALSDPVPRIAVRHRDVGGGR